MSRQRPRVLHLGKFYPPVRGGIEQVVASLCDATRHRLDNRVIVFNRGRDTVRESVDGIAVTRLGSISPARSTPIAPALLGEIRRADPDLVVLHEPNPWALLCMTVAGIRAPLAIWYHSEVVRPAVQYALFYYPMVRLVYGRAASIIVASPAMAEHAGALRPYRDRISVIPYGIDEARWEVTPAIELRAQDIRAGAGGRPLVVFAGRLVEYKGCDVLLRALVGLDVSAILAGEGPLREKLAATAVALGLSERVRFAGDVTHDELTALYHAADVFVLPSTTHAEAFGFVQVEAMACGTPVISTRVPSGVPWVNQHGVTGLVVDPGDPAALHGALRALISDPATCDRMAVAARRRVRKEFSIETMGERAAALFEGLAARSGARG